MPIEVHMITCIDQSNRNQHATLRRDLHKLRHKVFIEGRKWTLPIRGDLEIDQYDCDAAVYFCETDDDGAIRSHVRLTPTVTHSLMADYFPHLVNGRYSPRDPLIYEATRYIVMPAKKSRDTNKRAKAQLLLKMMSWAAEQGLSHIQTVIDTATFASFVEMTQQTIPLGLSAPFGGGPGVPGGGDCMGIRWPVNHQVICDLRSYAGFDCGDCELQGVSRHPGRISD
jgi:acyl-homoserine lactone synthase